MRTFVIGDIHGGFKALLQLLNKLEVKETDTLIFVGDYVDGWSESAQVIALLITVSKKINCVFIKGNHDVWCEDWLKTGHVAPVWYMNGGKQAIESYIGFTEEEKKKHVDFFKKMPLYHIDKDNRLFIHAGFTSKHGVEEEVFKTSFYFDRTLWEMALTVKTSNLDDNSQLYPQRIKLYKEIYIGHTPTTDYNCFEPMNALNVWNVDTGAAFTGKLSAINIDTKEVFQSDVLKNLYPDESGRNKL